MAQICNSCFKPVKGKRVIDAESSMPICYECARFSLRLAMDADREKVSRTLLKQQQRGAANKNGSTQGTPPLLKAKELNAKHKKEDAKEVAVLLHRLIRERAELKKEIQTLRERVARLQEKLDHQPLALTDADALNSASTREQLGDKVALSEYETSKNKTDHRPSRDIRQIWERHGGSAQKSAQANHTREAGEVSGQPKLKKLSLIPLAEGNQHGSAFINGGRD